MFGSIMSENQSPVKRILKFPRFELYFQVIWYLEGKIEMFERKYCEWISCFSQFSEVNTIYFIVEGLILLYSIGFTVYLLEFDTCVVGIGVDNWMEFIFGYFWKRWDEVMASLHVDQSLNWISIYLQTRERIMEIDLVNLFYLFRWKRKS